MANCDMKNKEWFLSLIDAHTGASVLFDEDRYTSGNSEKRTKISETKLINHASTSKESVTFNKNYTDDIWDIVVKKLTSNSSTIDSKQFLYEKFNCMKLLDRNGNKEDELVLIIQAILEHGILDQNEVIEALFSHLNVVAPLSFIWKLADIKLGSFAFLVSLLLKNDTNEKFCKFLILDSRNLMFDQIYNKKSSISSKETVAVTNKVVLKDFLSFLVSVSYNQLTFEHKNFQIICSRLLKEVIAVFLSKFSDKDCDSSVMNDKQLTEHKTPVVNIFGLVLENKTLTDHCVQKIFRDQLVNVLTFKPEISLISAIQNQCKWTYSNVDNIFTESLFSLVKAIGIKESFLIVDNVAKNLEVNWKNFLSFVGVLLLTNNECAQLLTDRIDYYIRNSCESEELDFLIVGLLLARHAAFEGCHVFPSYRQWYSTTFSNEISSPTNNKQSFSFLFGFLNELVPYENSSILKSHIHQNIFVPKGCQTIYRDYICLAKTRLQDLEGSSTCSLLDFDKKDEINKAMNEIKSAVNLFKENGKVLCSVIEASIFKRPYFIKTFLQILLEPKKLPDHLDDTTKFINALHAMNKIPQNMYANYIDQCKKIENTENVKTTEDVNFVEYLSPMQLFVSCMKKLIALHLNTSDKNFCIKFYENEILKKFSNLSKYVNDILKNNENDFQNKEFLFESEIVDKIKRPDLAIEIVHQLLSGINDLLCNINEGDLSNMLRISLVISNLLKLCCSSSNLQASLFFCLTHFYKNQGNECNFQVSRMSLGVILKELHNMNHQFLKIKLNFEVYSITTFFLKILPHDNALSLCFSVCVLQYAIKWNTKVHVDLFVDKYFMLAARLVSADLSSLEMMSNMEKIVATNELPNTNNHHLPFCCQLLDENIICSVEFKHWIEFEISADWIDKTCISTKLRHLKFWFCRFMKSNRKLIVNAAPKTPNRNCVDDFHQLFWSIVTVTGNKKNTALLLILLQELSHESELFPALSLLLEWQSWKERFFNSGDENVPNMPISYDSFIITFISLCQSLNRKLFLGNHILALNLFSKIIPDILGAESSLRLRCTETAFFLQCLLDAITLMHLPPNSSNVAKALEPLKNSVLHNFDSLRSMIQRNISIVEHQACFKPILNFLHNNVPWNWESETTAIFILSHKCENLKKMPSEKSEHVCRNNEITSTKIENMCEHFKECFKNVDEKCVAHLCAYVGLEIIHGRTNIYRFDENLTQILLVYSFVSNYFLRLNDVDASINVWNVGFKNTDDCAPLFRKTFLIGLSYLLRKFLNRNNRDISAFVLYLLLFNELSLYFERNENFDINKGLATNNHCVLASTNLKLLESKAPLENAKSKSSPFDQLKDVFSQTFDSLDFISCLRKDIDEFVSFFSVHSLHLIPDWLLSQCDIDVSTKILEKRA